MAHHLIILVLCFAAAFAVEETINPSIVNADVERTLDLSTQLMRLTDLITLEVGGGATATSFLYSIDPALEPHLSFIDAKIAGKDKASSKPLEVERVTVKNHGSVTFYRIKLQNSISGLSSDKIRVSTVYTKVQRPYPAEITQLEPQLMQLQSNLYHFSPYQTRKLNVRVQLPSSKLESYSQEPKPVTQTGKEVKYGPYENLAAFVAQPLTLHYENNAPFLTVKNLLRWIEVSHWGNIAIEETVDLTHEGARLKGQFSRLDYQRGLTTKSSIGEFKTILPAAAKDVYYRDEIGNISTSHLRKAKDAMELELRPRFPLFGGWKTHYVLGYNVPSYEYLLKSGNKFALQIRLIDHIFNNQYVEHALVKIVLPEGASNIEVHTPYRVERLTDEKHFTYLDTSGRPVVVIRVRNAVEEHIQQVQITYTFDGLRLFFEPMLVVTFFALAFAIVIAYVRLDFSLSKSKKE